ncbi:MAG: DNA polymerase III subunit delta [Lentisphaerae bacterium]|nr:DNA polymerase III subunit delta [Lentisphaerota bacterium]MCP4102443.1 DNA polymerase III subunit delta [Lentisphaerota bacterium]
MSRLYLISGNDNFAIKAKTREVINELCGEDFRDNPDLEIIVGDSDDLKPEEMLASALASLNTPPFLSPDKKVWFKHFQHFDKALASNAKDIIKKRITELVKFIKQGIPEDMTLIIDGPDLDQRKAFFKACKATKGSEIHYFRKADISSKDYARTQYDKILDICGKAGKKIDQSAVQYLLETVGSDTGRLQSELEKLFCFVGNASRVTLKDCKCICSRTPEAMSWDFANALVERNMTAALDLVNTLMEQLKSQRGGNLELSLLSHAVRSFQEMVKAKQAASQLELPTRVGKSYFYSVDQSIKDRYPDNILLKVHPFRAYMICQNASNFSDRQLTAALRGILDANRKLVSGGGDPRIVLEQLIIGITRNKRRT